LRAGHVERKLEYKAVDRQPKKIPISNYHLQRQPNDFCGPSDALCAGAHTNTLYDIRR
jgi:hypothetical protein